MKILNLLVKHIDFIIIIILGISLFMVNEELQKLIITGLIGFVGGRTINTSS